MRLIFLPALEVSDTDQAWHGVNCRTGPAATFTNAAAYNQDTLQAPALPVPAPPTQFSIQLVDGGMTNLSIKQNGNFYGFSIEMSVAEMVCESTLYTRSGVSLRADK